MERQISKSNAEWWTTGMAQENCKQRTILETPGLLTQLTDVHFLLIKEMQPWELREAYFTD